MSITTKQRSTLKSMAMKMSPIFQIGKQGLSDESKKQISAALEARELIKINVLETSPVSAAEASAALVSALSCEEIQVIGNKIVLYRKSEKNPRIEL